MKVLGWILFGFGVGALARLIGPWKSAMGFVGTTLLAVIGSLLGGWFGQAMGWYAPDGAGGLIAATLGAVVVLAVFHLFRKTPVSTEIEDHSTHQTAA